MRRARSRVPETARPRPRTRPRARRAPRADRVRRRDRRATGRARPSRSRSPRAIRPARPRAARRPATAALDECGVCEPTSHPASASPRSSGQSMTAISSAQSRAAHDVGALPSARRRVAHERGRREHGRRHAELASSGSPSRADRAVGIVERHGDRPPADLAGHRLGEGRRAVAAIEKPAHLVSQPARADREVRGPALADAVVAEDERVAHRLPASAPCHRGRASGAPRSRP